MKLRDFKKLVAELPENLDEVDVVTFDSEWDWEDVNFIYPLCITPGRKEIDYTAPSCILIGELNTFNQK